MSKTAKGVTYENLTPGWYRGCETTRTDAGAPLLKPWAVIAALELSSLGAPAGAVLDGWLEDRLAELGGDRAMGRYDRAIVRAQQHALASESEHRQLISDAWTRAWLLGEIETLAELGENPPSEVVALRAWVESILLGGQS